jgi:hypothetical protein
MAATRKIAQMMSAALLGVFTLAPALTIGLGIAATASPAMAGFQTKDTIIFRSGRIVEGKVLKETATHVQVEIDVAGIKAITDYAKSDILSITKAETSDEAPATTPATASDKRPSTAPAKVEPVEGAPKVYVVELKGKFGVDISETPIRNAVRDARRHEVDYLIFVLDNDWSMIRYGKVEERSDDESEFQGFFRAEKINPAYTEEIEREWTKQPRVVFWVKKAMGGAAFLPLSCPEIYFHPQARMGGIGKMDKMHTQADQVVREKWFGAGMAHVEGMAIRGGYDPRIVRAMARDDFVLSVRYEGGRPVLLERMPENSDEFLLTDDGKDEREDTEEDLARGLGNDNLTLDADLAFKLGLSKGTVGTLEDLLFKLGIHRNHEMVKGQSEQIMRSWRNGIESAKSELRRIWSDFQRVPDGGANYEERTRNRGRRLRYIEQMQGLLRRYDEAINPRELGIPDYDTLELMKSQLQLEQLRDRR